LYDTLLHLTLSNIWLFDKLSFQKCLFQFGDMSFGYLEFGNLWFEKDVCSTILRSFGIFFPFWYVVPGKIWQTWFIPFCLSVCLFQRRRPFFILIGGKLASKEKKMKKAEAKNLDNFCWQKWSAKPVNSLIGGMIVDYKDTTYINSYIL
jgi:hypothetical protein